jgi:light-regulated signal transduction histidine kinase (bacteriophytochrome)
MEKNKITPKYYDEFEEIERIQRDMTNIFNNYRKEKETLIESHKAILNILEDSVHEKGKLETYQKALLNILEDNDSSIKFGEQTQKSLINILEDYNVDKSVLSDSQKAVINILDDFQIEKIKVEQTNQELILSNKELEAFSYTVSHDMRAPSRAINGFARIFEKKYADKLDEEGKALLNTIISEAIRMGQLIDDLLAFSRLGRKEVQKVKTDANAIVNAVLEELVREQEEYKKTKVIVNSLPHITCDMVLMRQVFTNLISNAMKFSSKKENAIVEIGYKEEGENFIFYIRDNGAGFDMKYYNKLFGVFQRLHDSHEFQGTGIGLAIVNRIVTRHGGKVWAESQLNIGSTFYFSIPKQ